MDVNKTPDGCVHVVHDGMLRPVRPKGNRIKIARHLVGSAAGRLEAVIEVPFRLVGRACIKVKDLAVTAKDHVVAMQEIQSLIYGRYDTRRNMTVKSIAKEVAKTQDEATLRAIAVKIGVMNEEEAAKAPIIVVARRITYVNTKAVAAHRYHDEDTWIDPGEEVEYDFVEDVPSRARRVVVEPQRTPAPSPA